MATPTIEEIYDKEIRPRSREERRRLVEIASKDLERESDKPNPAYDRTHEIFEQWRKEDEALTPEELERERLLWEQFVENINAERDRAGSRRIY